MRQAVGVWDELVNAYYDSNGYGGTTAEIYSYRLEEYSPGVHSASKELEMYRDDAIRISTEAAKTLLWIIKMFQEKYDCDITVEDQTLKEWEAKLDKDSGRCYRYHVHVIKIEE
jgi:hypothetical protein